MTSASYFYTLILVQVTIKSKRPGLFEQKVILLHDSTTPHSAKLAQSLLSQLKLDVFCHPVVDLIVNRPLIADLSLYTGLKPTCDKKMGMMGHVYIFNHCAFNCRARGPRFKPRCPLIYNFFFHFLTLNKKMIEILIKIRVKITIIIVENKEPYYFIIICKCKKVPLSESAASCGHPRLINSPPFTPHALVTFCCQLPSGSSPRLSANIKSVVPVQLPHDRIPFLSQHRHLRQSSAALWCVNDIYYFTLAHFLFSGKLLANLAVTFTSPLAPSTYSDKRRSVLASRNPNIPLNIAPCTIWTEHSPRFLTATSDKKSGIMG